MDEWNEQVQLALLRAEARRRYQVLINFIKEQVEPGFEYANELVRVVLSERGCYYEFVDLPEEFSGALGSGFTHEFVGTADAVALAHQVHDLTRACTEENTREFSMLVVYERQGIFRRDGTYIYHCAHHGEADVGPLTVGYHRENQLPLFLKLRADSDIVTPIFGVPRGVLFVVANLSDQHLVVTIPQVGDGLADLAQAPTSEMIH
ncbi:MAG: hypothetical protein JSV65_19440 [Armatimonadota bacterium]|nr:MAG: hypothetical protein JSV65_19440 [Armatimonadota bacterium]